MASHSIWTQVKVLVYRNYLLKKRRRSETFQELIMPLYFVVLLVILKNFAYKPESNPEIPQGNTTDLFSNQNLVANNTLFYVAPQFAEAELLINTIEGFSPMSPKNLTVTYFNTLLEMETAYKANSVLNPIGIFFPNKSIDDYMLRFPFTSLPSSATYDFSERNCRLGQPCPANLYLTSGFATLQAMIDTAIMQIQNVSVAFPSITVQRMAKSGNIANGMVFQILTALYLVMALSPLMVFLLVHVVYEKEKKIKEGMKMMGLYNLALWLGWSATYTIMMFFITLIMTMVAVFGKLFPNSNFLLIFLILFLYAISLQMMAFMLTPFFNKARSAGAFASFFTMILSLFYLLVAFVPNISTVAVCFLHLISPAGFAIGLDKIAALEVTSGGATFSTIWEGTNPLGLTYIFLSVDIVLYFMLTLYFDNVIPSEYGQRNSIIFCLLPSFWCPSKSAKTNEEFSNDVTSDREAVDDDFLGKEAVVIRNITKVYEPLDIFSSSEERTVAVKNFSLDIYEGQITAILGHNGAGKTTLFNILTGFVEATSGTASIFNYDVRNPSDMLKIRQMTGVCPQHNILMDRLSVLEHLNLFAGIKGIPQEQQEAEIDRVLKLVDLEDQAETFSNKLSGGQKRKLSVGIAIIGDPKILILDEPTAGMDPYSRHKLWDVLRSRKEGRITLLTTHFMDEADILADRKAILSKGQLRCVGSSLFLKNKYGVGYHLGIVTKSSNKVEDITACVKSHVEDCELHRTAGFELSYTLPLKDVDKFAGLFADLELKGDNLEIQSFGVSMTNLEEVFLQIGEGEFSEDTENQPQDNGNDNKTLLIEQQNGDGFETVPVTEMEGGNASAFSASRAQAGKGKNWNIFKALLWKNFLIAIRRPAVIIFGLILPMGIAIGGGAVFNIGAPVDDQNDPLPVTLAASTYGKLLYKNSTGASLDGFLQYPTGAAIVPSNLTNLLKAGFNPMATHIFNYENFTLQYNALYNTSATHSLPSIINYMSASMLSSHAGNTTHITAVSKKWPSTRYTPPFSGSSFGGTLMSAVALVLSSALAIINPVKEKELKIRSQLRVSGTQFNIYWLAQFTIDYIWFMLVAIALLIGFVAFRPPPFVPAGAFLATVFLLIGWGAVCVLASYCGSFLFKKYETAQSVWPNVIYLSAILCYITVSLLDQLGNPEPALYINIVLTIFVPYYIGFGGIFYITKVYTVYTARGIADVPTSVYFDWSNPMVPFAILMSYIHIVVLFLILKILDVTKSGGSVTDVFPFSLFKVRSSAVNTADVPDYDEVIDEDVKQEEDKIKDLLKQDDPSEQRPVVITHKLMKEFNKRTKSKMCSAAETELKVAVKNLSLAVYPGEVFGLLGPNGAGKTTAINSIIADHAPTSGQIFVSGHNIQSNLSEVFQEMGYCPQDDPLWEEITLREHLNIYAYTQGVLKHAIPTTVDSCIRALGIEEHAEKKAKALSGGTKRKVCFAIAMIGNPQVVLLDEPSTGMDPKTKRFMWDTISGAFAGSTRGAILTTHYMDEADALCSRVGIMVKGQLQCLGSTQHLKNKFGQGYSLELKMQPNHQNENQQAIQDFVKNLFGDVTTTHNFAHRFVYKVSQDSMPNLSKVFRELEQAKRDLGIEEYSFSQSTLEQVFLQFARQQEEDNET
nr:ATP-binding cassette sub-family A member 5-like isoform X1 [Ciona intestinalis]XP_026691844.1 ATP-binding cassette sub-family A member 5-like isoform X2 [Ciona intestinalis]|eukprot:XP_018669065.1 ATP-binding cassette sub-family A member 5-like isoform X1 [Ciona intestinalis]